MPAQHRAREEPQVLTSAFLFKWPVISTSVLLTHKQQPDMQNGDAPSLSENDSRFCPNEQHTYKPR